MCRNRQRDNQSVGVGIPGGDAIPLVHLAREGQVEQVVGRGEAKGAGGDLEVDFGEEVAGQHDAHHQVLLPAAVGGQAAQLRG